MLEKLEERYKAIAKEVETLTPNASERVKSEIKAFYRELEELGAKVQELQSKLRELAQRYKEKAREWEEGKDAEISAAARMFLQRMRASPVNVLTLIDKGWNLITTGDYEEAIDVLKKAVSLEPDNIKAMSLLGWAYTYADRYDEAFMVYQKVLSMDPDNSMARCNLGYILYKKGIYGEAIEQLSRVIKENRDRSAVLYARYYMGLVYLDREMFSDAVHFFKEALKLGPNLSEAYYYLGVAHKEMGDIESAKKMWEECIGKNPNSQWAKKAKKLLKEVEA